MASFNRVILMGNLTKDPEIRYIPSGTAVGDLSLAVSETFKNKAGEQVETTCFVDVVVWARQAETCGEYLSKGSPVLVEGRLQLDKWKTKEGENRSKIRVRADRVKFLGGRPRSEDEFQGAGSARAEAGPAKEKERPPPVASTPDRVEEPAPPEPGDAGDELGDEDNLPF